MATNEGVLATWELDGVYYARAASYGGAAGADKVKVVENTKAQIPEGAARTLGYKRTGRNEAFEGIEDHYLGRYGMNSWTLEFDLTPTVWRDMMLLLFQNTQTLVSTTHYQLAPTLNPEVTMWAYIYQFMTRDTSQFAGWVASSAIPKTVTLRLPSTPPGGEAPPATLVVDFIARSRTRLTDYTSISSPVEDPADAIFGHLPSFAFDVADTPAVYHDLLDAEITFGNGAFLSPESSTTGYSPRILMGIPTITGRIKTYVEDLAVGDSLAKKLLTSREGASILNSIFNLTPGDVYNQAEIPFVVQTSPNPEDMDGVQAIDFTFKAAIDATAAVYRPLINIEKVTGAGTGIATSLWNADLPT